MRSASVAALGVSALGLAPAVGRAHVGSSEAVNNRYYKLAPMADRVRIVYTIFFGQQPGATARRGMDLDGDGQLSEGEVSAFGETLQSEVFRSTRVTLGGADAPIRWKAIDMGMGTNAASGGAFSADLIGTVCLASRDPGRQHQLRFRDSLRLPNPGETELHVDPAPGIRLSRSVIGGREIGVSGHKWKGGPGPAQQGYELHFFVDRQDSAGLDDQCRPPPKKQAKLGLVIAALSGGVLALASLGWWALRRRRRAA